MNFAVTCIRRMLVDVNVQVLKREDEKLFTKPPKLGRVENVEGFRAQLEGFALGDLDHLAHSEVEMGQAGQAYWFCRCAVVLVAAVR